MEKNINCFENNFATYYPENLLSLSDGKLRTEDGRSFPIHKVVLAQRSKYFSSMFSNTRGEEDILIPGIKGEDVSNILSFLYTNNIHVTEENIFDLIVVSGYLQIDDLLFELKQHLRKNLTLANGLSIFKISVELNLDDHFRECFRFIQTHFESIVRCWDSEIPELPLEALKLLLRDKNLRVTSENIVWLSIVKWVEADTHNRLAFVPELMMHLSIADIDENVANGILQHDIVANNPCCQEIYHGKSLISDADKRLALQCYFQTHIRSLSALNERRQPSYLNLIAYEDIDSEIADIQIYVTYDENIDLWRKLTGSGGRRGILLTVNDCIYMFDEDRFLYYRITKKQWNELEGFRTPRSDYQVVKLNGLIYVLGGYSEDIDGNVRDVEEVEVYDCETGEWHFTTPMLNAAVNFHFHAIAYNNVIYTLAYKQDDSGGKEMVAQAFDTTSETWNVLPPPSCIRRFYSMAVYHGMVYVVGGCFYSAFKEPYLKDVEVFDPINNEWRTEVNLPEAYYIPRTVILNDKLIVYDIFSLPECDFHPPVQWNVDQRCWDTLENSPMKDLRMRHFTFLTIETSECINVLSTESKDPTIVFERSPFSSKFY